MTDMEELTNGSMPTFMREAHTLVSLQFSFKDDARDEEEQDKEIHDLMDTFTNPHGVMMYLASYVAGDFPRVEDWQKRLLEVEEVFRG